jgi:hypothetical protein
VAVVGTFAGLVRLMPWLLDPKVTLATATPFARALLELAAEAAILLGWPLGWALACTSFVERGEARAMAALGQSPKEVALRLWPQAIVFVGALAVVSFAGGVDASAPGRVVTELLAQGRKSCVAARQAETYAVPFADVTWLCSPEAPPRLAGHGPGALSAAEFTATSARVSGDLREIDLSGVHVSWPLGPREIDLSVSEMRFRGLSAFAQATTVPPLSRAVALAASATIAAIASAVGVLSGALRGRAAAIVASASVSLAALGAMRSINAAAGRSSGYPPSAVAAFEALAAPMVAFLAAAVASIILSRLPRGRWTASK